MLCFSAFSFAFTYRAFELFTTNADLHGEVGSSSGLRGVRLAQDSRRLGRYSHIAAYSSATATAGCVTVDLSSVSVTLDLSTTACNGNRCPPCFIITGGNDISSTLSLDYCSTMLLTSSIKMGDGSQSNPAFNSMQTFTFMNTDTSKAALIADTSGDIFVLRPNAAASALCYKGGSNKLYWFGASNAAPVRFVFMQDNTNVCTKGQHVITEAVCRWAWQTSPPCTDISGITTAVQGVTTGGQCSDGFQVVNTATDPKGCFWASFNRQFYYNQHATGASLGMRYPVCWL